MEYSIDVVAVVPSLFRIVVAVAIELCTLFFFHFSVAVFHSSKTYLHNAKMLHLQFVFKLFSHFASIISLNEKCIIITIIITASDRRANQMHFHCKVLALNEKLISCLVCYMVHGWCCLRRNGICEMHLKCVSIWTALCSSFSRVFANLCELVSPSTMLKYLMLSAEHTILNNQFKATV